MPQLWKNRTSQESMSEKDTEAINRAPRKSISQMHIVEESEETIKEYSLYNTSTGQKPKPMMIPVKIEDITLSMELDTGASVSIISEKTYKKWLSSKALQKSTVSLRTYTGEPLDVMGSMEVEVKYKSQEARLPLLVVTGEGPCLLGRDWLQQIQLDWREIHSLQQDPLDAILHQHEKLFQEGLGTMQGYKARFLVDDKVKPKFCKARPVPYAMRALVEQELDRLTKEGIIEPVQFAEWAAPIVPVLKSDKKSVRICGDFKLTIKPSIET